MGYNVTFLDRLLANRTYFSQIKIARDASGYMGLIKITLMYLGVLNSISVKIYGKTTEVTKDDFLSFWRNEAIALNYKNTKIRISGEWIYFKYKNKKIKFKVDSKSKRVTNETISLINEQFFIEQYGMDFLGKKVVDIGAYIGDSPIYFALNGASIVYAYEPYPYAYEIAIKNIRVNKLSDKILLYNEGVDGKRGVIKISNNYVSGAGSRLNDFENGKQIKIVTLKSIVKKYGITDGFLKSDCEGSENSIILSADIQSLRSFQNIIIEYHNGYISLKKKLESVGFDVSFTRPVKMLQVDGKPYTYSGILTATRKDLKYTNVKH